MKRCFFRYHKWLYKHGRIRTLKSGETVFHPKHRVCERCGLHVDGW